MKYKITDSTDKKFLGSIVDYDISKNNIVLNGKVIFIDKKTKVGVNEIRLSNSNYSIDLIGV